MPTSTPRLEEEEEASWKELGAEVLLWWWEAVELEVEIRELFWLAEEEDGE